MRFGVLGPLQVVGDDGPVALGGQKERLLLALLLTRPNRVIAVDTLAEGLWGDAPPRSAAKTLQSYVVRLRHALEPDRPRGAAGEVLVTRSPGYLLRVAPEALDATRFEQLTATARRLLADGDAQAAAAVLADALGLWRGGAFEGLAEAELTGAEAARLEELRLGAVEDRIQAELALGRHRELISELERLTGEQPWRERFWAQLLLALYRAGRQADALLAYGRARSALVEELGIDPGAELRGLHAQILAQDPALDAPPRLAPVVPELPEALDPGGRPLVGRQAELEWLRGAWQRAAGGHGGLALVTGPSGMGRTRLAAELAREAYESGAVVLYGRCQPGPDDDPLRPLSRALAASGLGERPTPGDPATAGAALAEFVARRAADHPVLLVVDDLDRAGPASLEMLGALGVAATALRLLLVGAADLDAAASELAALIELADQDGAGHRRLPPLDLSEVAQVAAWYADASEAASAAGGLLAETSGVPERVHRAASTWARTLAAQRVDQAAGRAVRERTRLRVAQAELADGVADLQHVSEQVHAALTVERATSGEGEGDGARLAAVLCPYKGLARYEPGDAAYFFGRERLVAELVAQLVGAGLLGIVGPSGSGKSSAVRAGLLPALRDGVLPSSGQWRHVLVRPGEHPLAELARAAGADGSASDPDGAPDQAIRRLATETERLVLVIDQFEELFTTCPDETERGAFVAALTAAASAPDGYASIVIAVRADYYGRCAAYPELARLLAANHVLVGPMDHEELRRAIRAPAGLAGLHLEPGLTEALLADVTGEPGGLPLLSTALLESWEHRRGRAMTLAAYHQAGGVRGAVARLAERAWQQLDPDEQQIARRLLLRLAGPGEGDQAVRRRVPVAEVAAERDQPAGQVLAVLTDRRLLTVDEGTVEVAHEALLREWPRLRGWLADDVQGRALHRHLATAAREWDQAGRDPGELYRGARLTAVIDWARDHDADLNELERAFLAAGRAAGEREVAEARRRAEQEVRYSRRLRAALAGLAGVLAVALAVGVLAVVQRGNAWRAALVADARRLGAQALVEGDLDRSLLLAVAGNRLDDSVDTRNALLASLLRSPQAVQVLRAEGDRLQDLALSRNGQMLAAVDNRGRLIRWDARTGQRYGAVFQVEGGRTLGSVVFSPDGRTVAAAGEIGLVLWDATARAPAGVPLGGGDGLAREVAFSPDGRFLAAGNADGSVDLWDPASRTRLGKLATRYPQDFTDVTFSPDSTTLLTVSFSQQTVLVWDVATRRVVRRLRGQPGLTVSRDGRTVAIPRDNSVLLTDLATGRVRRTLTGHTGRVQRVAFSRDGRLLASTSDDRTAIVWDVATGEARETLRGHNGRVLGVAFSPDGRTLYTDGLDASVMIWDLVGARRLGRMTGGGPMALEENRPQLAVSPDGTMLALGGEDGQVALWDTTTNAPLGAPLDAHAGGIKGLAFSPDGRTLAAGTRQGTVVLWDLGTHSPVGRLRHHPGPLRGQYANNVISDVAFSLDGRRLAVAGNDDSVTVWDVATRSCIGQPLRPSPGFPASSPAFSPDGSTVAVGDEHGLLSLWDAATSSLIWKVRADRAFVAMPAFAPDGRTIAAGGFDGVVHLLDARTGKALGVIKLAQRGFVLAVSYSPDGGLLAVSGTDGTVTLWDVRSRKQIGTPLPVGRPNMSALARFSPAGGMLASTSLDGTVVLWDVDPAHWRAHACAVAGRDLTRQEWAEFLPGRPYQAPCPGSGAAVR